jgi:hypothetical protein
MGITITDYAVLLCKGTDALLKSHRLETGECRADAEVEFYSSINSLSLLII